MEKLKNYKVVATLERGSLYTTGFAILVWAALALCMLITSGLIFIASYFANSSYLYGAVLPIIMGALVAYFAFCDLAKRIQARKCLKDGVLVQVDCAKVMESLPMKLNDGTKYSKICVRFEYDGKIKKIYSGLKGYVGRGSFEKLGFCKAFSRFVGKTVTAVYSPSVGDVLLLECI